MFLSHSVFSFLFSSVFLCIGFKEIWCSVRGEHFQQSRELAGKLFRADLVKHPFNLANGFLHVIEMQLRNNQIVPFGPKYTSDSSGIYGRLVNNFSPIGDFPCDLPIFTASKRLATMKPKRSFTPHELRKLAQFFFDGFSLNDIAFYFDVSVPFIRQIQAGDEIPSIRRATLDMKMNYIAMIRDGSQRHWSRIAWFLERRWPKEFARPEVQLSMSESITTNNTLVVSAEVAEALLKRSKAVTTEIDSLLDAKRPPASEASEPERSEGE